MSIGNFCLNNGYRAIQYYKFHVILKKLGFRRVSRLVLAVCENSTGVEFSIDCIIGQKLKIAHGHDIVIGGRTSIGSNVTVYNGVTFGVSGKLYLKDGKVMQHQQYPIIEDNCIIYSGAKILGDIRVGRNSIIAANSVVIHDIPENSVVAGIPGVVVKQNMTIGND